ncbi:hypothetical protein J6590_064238 [Homalodisca vitripennis]|nr:hypothetical protein J6590_064238 [Homalodisca vitripennis]
MYGLGLGLGTPCINIRRSAVCRVYHLLPLSRSELATLQSGFGNMTRTCQIPQAGAKCSLCGEFTWSYNRLIESTVKTVGILEAYILMPGSHSSLKDKFQKAWENMYALYAGQLCIYSIPAISPLDFFNILYNTNIKDAE